METLLFYILITLVVVAFIRSLVSTPEPPRVIYVEREPRPLSNQAEGSGCLPLLVLGFIILVIVWFA